MLNKQRLLEIKKKSWKKKYDVAPWIECACRCGEKIKNVDKYGRKKSYISGHNVRIYPVGYDPKKAYNTKNKEIIRKRAKENKPKRKRYHREFKVELVKLKGGQCTECNLKYNGKNAAGFDFHHVDPKNKEFDITFGIRNRARKKVLEEVEKCVLMCSVCHNIYHSGEY